MKTKTLHLVLPEELHKALKVLAAEKGTTLTQLLVTAAERLIERHRKD